MWWHFQYLEQDQLFFSSLPTSLSLVLVSPGLVIIYRDIWSLSGSLLSNAYIALTSIQSSDSYVSQTKLPDCMTFDCQPLNMSAHLINISYHLLQTSDHPVQTYAHLLQTSANLLHIFSHFLRISDHILKTSGNLLYISSYLLQTFNHPLQTSVHPLKISSHIF